MAEASRIMSAFELDSQLKRDCLILSESQHFILLLMNNALLPWFILVPKTDKVELFELDETTSTRLYALINKLSRKLDSHYQPDKLNIAAIGNVVRQLHVHIVVRYRSDCCWPGVVWGTREQRPYPAAQLEKIKTLFDQVLVL
jgi:diadenosine tetraphosphate (Ap4A) HIT family hydrolase